jgi:hypothetical protein
MKVEGGCHCGAVRFEAEISEAPVPALDCNCSVCRMTGFLHVMVPHERFELLTGRARSRATASAPARPNICSAATAA